MTDANKDTIFSVREEILSQDPYRGAMPEGKAVHELLEENIRDPLTGAYNRKFFEEKVLELMGEGEIFTVVALDVDRFKKINDTKGHEAGDSVLREFYRVLNDHIRQTDDGFVARLGGDEFAIVIPGLKVIKAAKKRANELCKHVRQSRFRIQNDEHSVTTSVGVGVWNGYSDKEVFLKDVDRALYLAKNNGRNRVEVAK
ncbi:MAG TPA: GGDEF domain-containing protein [Patescibacteria group bacterium]|nr:GGDEF domain-containing protein [Patescibacteria group bacterium]